MLVAFVASKIACTDSCSLVCRQSAVFVARVATRGTTKQINEKLTFSKKSVVCRCAVSWENWYGMRLTASFNVGAIKAFNLLVGAIVGAISGGAITISQENVFRDSARTKSNKNRKT